MGDERKNRVFIGGISDRIQKEDIEKEFGRFGKLTNVWVAQNPPGFAFVEYDHISEADVAVAEMNGQSFLGSSNKLRVEHSHGGSSRSRMRRGGGPGDRGMRGGGGGYRSDRGPREGGFRDGGGGGGYRSNGGSNGFGRPREAGGYRSSSGGSGGYSNGDKRRSFPSSGGGGGSRFNGPPRYRNGSAERSYSSSSYGGRRSRSPVGRSKYGGLMDQGFSPVPGTFIQNRSPY